MFRKHFNTLDEEYFLKKDPPFYPWECITIQLQERDIYLIIRNEKIMEQFLMILIHSISTVDGNRNSSRKIEQAIIDQYYKEHKKESYSY
jgi:hypothetical protein